MAAEVRVYLQIGGTEGAKGTTRNYRNILFFPFICFRILANNRVFYGLELEERSI